MEVSPTPVPSLPLANPASKSVDETLQYFERELGDVKEFRKSFGPKLKRLTDHQIEFASKLAEWSVQGARPADLGQEIRAIESMVALANQAKTDVKTREEKFRTLLELAKETRGLLTGPSYQGRRGKVLAASLSEKMGPIESELRDYHGEMLRQIETLDRFYKNFDKWKALISSQMKGALGRGLFRWAVHPFFMQPVEQFKDFIKELKSKVIENSPYQRMLQFIHDEKPRLITGLLAIILLTILTARLGTFCQNGLQALNLGQNSSSVSFFLTMLRYRYGLFFGLGLFFLNLGWGKVVPYYPTLFSAILNYLGVGAFFFFCWRALQSVFQEFNLESSHGPGQFLKKGPWVLLIYTFLVMMGQAFKLAHSVYFFFLVIGLWLTVQYYLAHILRFPAFQEWSMHRGQGIKKFAGRFIIFFWPLTAAPLIGVHLILLFEVAGLANLSNSLLLAFHLSAIKISLLILAISLAHVPLSVWDHFRQLALQKNPKDSENKVVHDTENREMSADALSVYQVPHNFKQMAQRTLVENLQGNEIGAFLDHLHLGLRSVLFFGLIYILLESGLKQFYFFTSPLELKLLSHGEMQINVKTLLAIFFWYFFVRGAYLIIIFLIDRSTAKIESFDQRLLPNLATVIKYFSIALFIGIALNVIGLNVKNIILITSALGVGIGFGLQNIVNNFISGIILLFERPVRVGDIIEMDGREMVVRKIGIRSIQAENYDNAILIIPNSDILSSRVINWSLNDNLIAFRAEVRVAYGSDLAKVEKIFLAVAEKNPRILNHPKPLAWCRNLSDSGVDFIIKCWTNDPDRKGLLRGELLKDIDIALRKEHIVIPFPQTDVHIRQEIRPS